MAADFWMFNRDWEGRGADAPRPCAEQLRSLRPSDPAKEPALAGERYHIFCRAAALGGRKYEQSNRDLWEHGVQ